MSEPKRPKAKHSQYGEPKDQEIKARLTQTGKQGLIRQAQAKGVSLGEFLEQLGREQILIASSSLSGEC